MNDRYLTFTIGPLAVLVDDTCKGISLDEIVDRVTTKRVRAHQRVYFEEVKRLLGYKGTSFGVYRFLEATALEAVRNGTKPYWHGRGV